MTTIAVFRRRTVESAGAAARSYFEPLSTLTKLGVRAAGGFRPFQRFLLRYALLLTGMLGLGAGAWFLFHFVFEPTNVDDRANLILGGVSFLVALICLGVYFFIRFREEGEREIGITKF